MNSFGCPGRQVVGWNERRLESMRKLFLLTLMLLPSMPVLANDNEEASLLGTL